MGHVSAIGLESKGQIAGGLRLPVTHRDAPAPSHRDPMRCVEKQLVAKHLHFLALGQIDIDSDVCNLVSSPHDGRLILNVFKHERRRFVASIDKTTSTGKRLVIKAFPLRSLLAQLRWRRYGYREFCNHREAISRGIPTPELYAYFQVRNRFGLTENCGVLIENLAEHKILREAVRNEAIDRWQCLADVARLVQICHIKGANHIDLSVDNIMVGPDGLRVIDWQYATFFGSKRDRQIVMQTAYFLQTSPFRADSHEGCFFKKEVYARTRPLVSPEGFESLVDELSQGPRVSVRKRANLDLKVLRSLG